MVWSEPTGSFHLRGTRPRPESRVIQQFNSPPAAGLFAKVPMKPTNHSKFTGRCDRPRCLGCHMHPTCKSKDKTKGAHKLRSSDMVTNYRLITWRVVDKRPGLKFSGSSASRILDHLSNGYEDYEGNDDHEYDDNGDYQCGLGYDGFQSLEEKENHEGEIEENSVVDHSKDDDDEKNGDGVYVDDDDVKFVLDQDLEEEGWCLIGEI